MKITTSCHRQVRHSHVPVRARLLAKRLVSIPFLLQSHNRCHGHPTAWCIGRCPSHLQQVALLPPHAACVHSGAARRRPRWSQAHARAVLSSPSISPSTARRRDTARQARLSPASSAAALEAWPHPHKQGRRPQAQPHLDGDRNLPSRVMGKTGSGAVGRARQLGAALVGARGRHGRTGLLRVRFFQ